MWTGDSQVSYEDIPSYLNMALSLGVSGMIFTGSDLPGFVGDPSDDNFVQEYQMGVFMPFMRAHANIDSLDAREPWLRSPRVQQVIRNAIRQRYAQTHYLYTTFKHSTKTGTPILRPMWYEFPKDTNTFSLDMQFMFGDKFLVAPKITSPTEQHIDFHTPVITSVYLPVGVNWYYFWSGQPIAGQSDILQVPIADNEQGVWIREGSIIPLLNFQSDRMSLLQAINDPINLLIYPDLTSLSATGDLYLDDGETNAYLQNECTEVVFNWTNNLTNSTLTIQKVLSDDYQYPRASGKFINKAQIFNQALPPVKAVNTFISNLNNQDEVEIQFIYNAEEQTITLHDFLIPVDSFLAYYDVTDIITLFWE